MLGERKKMLIKFNLSLPAILITKIKTNSKLKQKRRRMKKANK